MDAIKNILINYWPCLLGSILFVISFILQLIKKKPINSIVELIYEACVKAINLIEASGMVGAEQKLANATAQVCCSLKARFPDLDVLMYKDLIHSIIEDILSTPQKKGGEING